MKTHHQLMPRLLLAAVMLAGNTAFPSMRGTASVIVPPMPRPGTMVSLSGAYSPALMLGVTVHPENGLRFDFLMQPGQDPLSAAQKKEEYRKLIKYFMAALTIPDKDQWVNLSPYEKGRVIEDNFGRTGMGRDLLAQDYLLKQITSSLMFPRSGLGREFWSKIYAGTGGKGAPVVPVNLFNKVWITPVDMVVYESGNTAVVLQSHLKVMLEEDFLAARQNQRLPGEGPAAPASMAVSRRQAPQRMNQAVRELILPALEKEVNHGKNFAALRQIVSAMIMAAWYKRALKESVLGKVYVNRDKIKGVDIPSSPNAALGDPQKIYEQYLQAFKKGAFSLVKEDIDEETHQIIPRKYFAGGFKADWAQLTFVRQSSNVSTGRREVSGWLTREEFERLRDENNRPLGINDFGKLKKFSTTRIQDIFGLGRISKRLFLRLDLPGDIIKLGVAVGTNAAFAIVNLLTREESKVARQDFSRGLEAVEVVETPVKQTPPLEQIRKTNKPDFGHFKYQAQGDILHDFIAVDMSKESLKLSVSKLVYHKSDWKSQEDIFALARMLKQPNETFSESQKVIDWLNTERPLEICVEHAQEFGIEEDIQRLQLADFMKWSNKNRRIFAYSSEGRVKTTVILNKIFPLLAPMKLFFAVEFLVDNNGEGNYYFIPYSSQENAPVKVNNVMPEISISQQHGRTKYSDQEWGWIQRMVTELKRQGAINEDDIQVDTSITIKTKRLKEILHSINEYRQNRQADFTFRLPDFIFSEGITVGGLLTDLERHKNDKTQLLVPNDMRQKEASMIQWINQALADSQLHKKLIFRKSEKDTRFVALLDNDPNSVSDVDLLAFNRRLIDRIVDAKFPKFQRIDVRPDMPAIVIGHLMEDLFTTAGFKIVYRGERVEQKEVYFVVAPQFHVAQDHPKIPIFDIFFLGVSPARTVVHKKNAGKDDDLGGIDLSAAQEEMRVKREGQGLLRPLAAADLKELENSDGFVPAILEISLGDNSPIITQIREELKRYGSSPASATAAQTTGRQTAGQFP